MKSIISLFLFTLITLSAFAQHEGHQHKQHLEILLSHYMNAKKALVDDNFTSAKKHLGAFAEEVKGSSEMNQHEEHAEKHEVHHKTMLQAVNEATEAEDLEEVREAFKKISDELITAVENQGYEGTLFKQFCPMYKGGSHWLSTEQEINNPFYGQSMHSCGDVVEKIKRKREH